MLGTNLWQLWPYTVRVVVKFARQYYRGGSRKKYLRGAWPLIIWEATTAKRNYYRTNYIKQVETLGLNYPEKIWGEPGQDLGGPVPPGPNIEPPLQY